MFGRPAAARAAAPSGAAASSAASKQHSTPERRTVGGESAGEIVVTPVLVLVARAGRPGVGDHEDGLRAGIEQPRPRSRAWKRSRPSLNDRLSIDVDIGIGLARDSPDVRATLSFPFSLDFRGDHSDE